MSSTIPQLTLFPLYTGGPKVSANTLNAYSSFYIPATKFTPQYGVNVPPRNNQSNASFSLDGRKVQGASNSASLLDQNIGFDAAVLGSLKKVPVPSVAPVIPNIYEQAAKLLSVSDLKMSELLAQPSFNIPAVGLGTGLGLKVTTDGSGGIDTVSISQSSRALNPNPNPLDPSFGGLKRAEITMGATFKTDLDTGLAGVLKGHLAKFDKPGVNNLAANLAALDQNQALMGPNPLSGLLQPSLNDLDLNALELNPIVQRLNQLQPPVNAGLPVSGYESVMGADEARQIAATQAKLNVVPSDQFRQNVAGLVSASNRQGDSYAAAMKPVSMDGRIPTAPSLPSTTHNVGYSGAGMAQDGFNPGGGMSNASDRKGSGGYIPFQMQSNTQGGFAGGAGNPFMAAGGFANQSNQQQQRRRLPAFVA